MANVKNKSRKKTKSSPEGKRGASSSGGSKRSDSSRSTGGRRKKREDTPEEAAARNDIRGMQEERRRSRLIDDIIWGIVYIAVGAFIFIAVQFQAAGQFGNALGDGLKGIFGLIGLILPWYLILIGFLLVLHKASHFSGKSLLACIVMLLMFCLLNSGRFIDAEHAAITLRRFFNDGVSLSGGGVFGMTAGTLLVRWIGKAGLYIFSFVVALISFLFLINTPLSDALESARDRREERQLMREQSHLSEAEPQSSAQTGRAGAGQNVRNASGAGSGAADPAGDIRIVTPYEDAAGGRTKPFAGRRHAGSNVVDFIKKGDPFGRDSDARDAADSAEIERGLEEVHTPRDGYGLDGEIHDSQESGLNTENYEGRKASASEIARGAAEIGEGLGLRDGAAALTKSVDKSLTKKYRKPPIDLLDKPQTPDRRGLNDDLKNKARLLEETMQNFNVDARVVQVTQGPAITRYEIQPNVGVKVSKIVNLADDIALNLRAKSIRIEAPIPGKAVVGIEVENDKINMVRLREIIDSREFRNAKSRIEFAVGKDIAGKPIVADLKSMPHLLIAGSTGSGKSVCINSIITSILYKANPDEVKMVLIDPKVVELGNYNGIPHLLIPVVTDPSKAAAALSWAVVEMTNRYKMFAESNVRDLGSYNRKMKADGNADMVMPQVVIIIDELADLMMAAPSQVEESICRLAQMARAAGMHLIVATQRPSVDIITGVIKANIPSRIAFAVSSQADSRTILDRGGAEHLVGKGDMLFNPLGVGSAVRIQGTFVSDEEVQRVIDFVKAQSGEADYSDEVMDTIENGNTTLPDKNDDADELLPDAIECVVMQGQASVSMLQRRYRIGYNRAARIVDEMEARGIVGPQDGSRPRQVLMSEEELAELKEKTQGINP
ncbi:hypothetical protein BHK98_01630 [Hornefia porci]|uniref:FtsK domain-containing protein n=1 Tax=Hornefia porci TaxID=2652292 RepID=A0A1Q9JFI6_9FIRM|nr:DNA translocase FtsK [Hornefia porci]OLR54894.1 hypothetical protein BHK98_01630 [Hornefia porci]